MTKYARKCTATGQGMNEGWCVGQGEKYFKHEEDAAKWAVEAGYEDIEEAFEHNAIYWTEWEEEFDYEYVEVDGVLREIEEVSQSDETLGIAGIVSHDQLDTQEYNRLLGVLGMEGMLMVFERWMDAEDLKSVISSAKDTLTDNGIPLP